MVSVPRVALQVSGKLRYNQECIDSLKSNIIEVLNPDIFCSFWEHEQDYLDSWINQLEPKLVEIENWNNIRPSFSSIYSYPVYSNLVPMTYKFYRVNCLKRSWERANKFSYDFVIQARTDGIYFQKFPIDQMQECINQSKLKMTLVYSSEIDPFVQPRMADTLYVGDNSSIDAVSSVIWMLQDQLKENQSQGLTRHSQVAEIIQSQCWNKLGVRWDKLCGVGVEGNFHWDLNPNRNGFR